MFESTIHELQAYYKNCSFRTVKLPFNPLLEKMDDDAAKHPELSPMMLKAGQYEIIAEHFTPVLFKTLPFFFETGLKLAEYDGHSCQSSGGWLLCRNLHLYEDHSPADYAHYLAAGEQGMHLVYGPYCDYDHHCFPFTNVLTHGLSGIFKQLEQAEKAPMAMCDQEKREFYHAAKCGLLALKKIAEKFAQAATEALAHAAPGEETEHLTRIAEAARRIPWLPADSFYEGLACLWFLHELGSVMDGVGMSVIGHPDRMLEKLYRQDVDSGRITREDAYRLICQFLLITDSKLDLDASVDKQYNGGEQGDTLILGGTDEAGNEIFNELTLLFLKAHRELKLTYPKIHCRLSSKTSDALLLETSKEFLAGRSVLSFLNDDIIIPAQTSAGKSYADAVHYVAGGCWEIILEGCEHSEGANCYFSLGKIMDYSIHHNPEAENALGLSFRKMDGAKSFEEVRDITFGNVLLALDQMCRIITEHGAIWPQVNPAPLFSACLKGCIESGMDYSAGGAKYSPHGVPFTGIAVFIDSLLAVKHLCFDRKICSLETLLDAVRRNWEGMEALRKIARNAPHFCGNCPESNELANWLLSGLADFLAGRKNERGGAFQPGIYSYLDIVFWADNTAATPDGRRKGDFLAQGLTPSRTAESGNVTEVIHEIARLPLKRFPANSLLTLSLSKAGLTEETLAAFLRSWCAAGAGGMLQLNCVSREELEDAEKHPEQYRDLVVRLYGYSAKFVALDEIRRKEFLSRTIY